MTTPEVQTPEHFNAVIYRRTSSEDGDEVHQIGPDDPDFGVISFCIFRTLMMLNTPAALEAMDTISYGVLQDNPDLQHPIELTASTFVREVFLPSVHDEFPAVCIDDWVTSDHGIGIVRGEVWKATGWHHSLVIQLNASFVKLVHDYAEREEPRNQQAILFRLINSMFLMVGNHILYANLAKGRYMCPPTALTPPKLETIFGEVDLIQRDRSTRWLEYHVLGGALRKLPLSERAIFRQQYKHERECIGDYEVGEEALNGVLGLEGEVIQLPYQPGRQIGHTFVLQPSDPEDVNADPKLPDQWVLPRVAPLLESKKTVPHRVLCTLGSNLHEVVHKPNIQVQVLKQEVKRKPSLMEKLKSVGSKGKESAKAEGPGSSSGKASKRDDEEEPKKKRTKEGGRKRDHCIPQ